MVYCFSPYGLWGTLVRVEIDVRPGLPGTDLIGLPGGEVREARDRVRVAIRNSGFDYSKQRVLVNLAPADVPKVGGGFDLAIAVAVLNATGQVRLSDDVLIMGELALDGSVRPARAVLAAAVAAHAAGIRAAIVHRSSASELTSIELNAVYGVERLRDCLHLTPVVPTTGAERREPDTREPISFDDIIGQPVVKRACAVAAAGRHNLLLMGPPGTGKTMSARRLVTLLPDLSAAESVRVARIYSNSGLTRPGGLLSRRPPLRAPHHSASVEGLVGGGRRAGAGELSLAHGGVLLLDEATEFKPRALQALREPLETYSIAVSRVGLYQRYPADVQVVMTANMCPCGYMGLEDGRCICGMQDVARYWRKIGGPLLDRIEIRVRTASMNPPAGASVESAFNSPSHAELVEVVSRARAAQAARAREVGARLNGRVADTALRRTPLVDRTGRAQIRDLVRSRGLSDRAAVAIERVARTVADCEGHSRVEPEDIAEAAALRAPADFNALSGLWQLPAGIPGLNG